MTAFAEELPSGSDCTITTPMGRLGRAEEVAAGASVLASRQSSFLTGSLSRQNSTTKPRPLPPLEGRVIGSGISNSLMENVIHLLGQKSTTVPCGRSPGPAALDDT